MIDLLLETRIRNSQRQFESFSESTNGHDLVRYIPWSEHFCEQSRTLVNALAEVDGNRTRRTGIARPNRFEGGGAHQVPGHLHPAG